MAGLGVLLDLDLHVYTRPMQWQLLALGVLKDLLELAILLRQPLPQGGARFSFQRLIYIS